MPIPTKLKNYLDKNKIKYEVLEHKKVYTAHDAAETQRVEPRMVVKTLVVKLDSDYAFALVPANRKLDKDKLKKVVNASRKKTGEKPVKKVDLASEAWMKKNLLGKVGATPPFGKIQKNLPVYLYSLLTKSRKLIVGAGEYTKSIELSTSQYLKLEEPVKGSFSQVKK